MADISNLEGINSDEVTKFCQSGVTTVEEFLASISPHFNYGIMHLSIKTGIKPERLIQFVPIEFLRTGVLPDFWLEGLVARVLYMAPPDNPWLKRCRSSLKKFARGLRGNWVGWKENLPIGAMVFATLLILALGLRATGGMQWLPWPLGLRDRALIVAHDMPSGKTLNSSDVYPALLSFHDDYFRPDDNVEGLILARPVSNDMPLRFHDVLRQQVIATKDIRANTIIQKEDVNLAWTAYRPGVALDLDEVCGRQASQPIRKDGLVLSEFIKLRQ